MDVLAGLMADLERQRAFVADRAPVWARVLALLPEVLPLDHLADVWAHRTFGGWYERPLLFLAALRDDALEQGPDHPLWAAIVDAPAAHAVTAERLRDALRPDQGLWRKLPVRHVQTNETSRAVAWMWPAHLLAGASPLEPLDLVDIGASAGLNLVADALPRVWTHADGTPLTVDPLPAIRVRRGYDLRPMDLSNEEDARWLRACVWPGQVEREQRLDAAIAAFRAAEPRPELITASAGDVPDLLPRDSERVLAYQTITRDYLPAEERQRYEAGMRRWLAEMPAGTAVWVELEQVPGNGRPAAITAHTHEASVVLGRCDPHPTTIDVDRSAAAMLQDITQR